MCATPSPSHNPLVIWISIHTHLTKWRSFLVCRTHLHTFKSKSIILGISGLERTIFRDFRQLKFNCFVVPHTNRDISFSGSVCAVERGAESHKHHSKCDKCRRTMSFDTLISVTLTVQDEAFFCCILQDSLTESNNCPKVKPYWGTHESWQRGSGQ